MRIGIIGTGHIGGCLAQKLQAAGHDVRVANSRGVEGVRAFAEKIGVTPADARGAVDGAELVILSIPFPAIADLPKDLFDGLPDDVPVVDTGNYYPVLRDPHIAEIDAGEVESLWVSRQIGRPIIKAFNNILAHSLRELGRPPGSSGRLAITIAGDSAAAKAMLGVLVNALGFDPADAGGLADSWRQEPSTPGYCCDYGAAEMRRCLASAKKGEAKKRRDNVGEHLAALPKNATHADLVAMNRRVNVPD
jgi:predicted dinucleotide-binding enzyme